MDRSSSHRAARGVPGGRSGHLLDEALRGLDIASQALVDPCSDEELVVARAAVDEVRAMLTTLLRERDRGPVQPASPSVERRLALAPDQSAAGLARAFCRDVCEQWSLGPGVVSAAADTATELVSNAVRHGSGELVLALELSTERLTVKVRDDGPARPRLLPYRPGVSRRGLGLHLVQQLSEQWGWTADGTGKWVWAALRCGRRAPAGGDRPP